MWFQRVPVYVRGPMCARLISVRRRNWLPGQVRRNWMWWVLIALLYSEFVISKILWQFVKFLKFICLLFFLNLAAPSINIAPPPNIEVEIGGYFTIICEAVGTPTPLIVWRLNWGNIPTGDRVHVSSINGRGNLTITDARVEDSGAYTCEAINVRGSIFASPDAIIIVRRKLRRWGCICNSRSIIQICF